MRRTWEQLADDLGPQPSAYHPAPYSKPPTGPPSEPAYYIERDEYGEVVRLWFRGIPVEGGDAWPLPRRERG